MEIRGRCFRHDFRTPSSPPPSRGFVDAVKDMSCLVYNPRSSLGTAEIPLKENDTFFWHWYVGVWKSTMDGAGSLTIFWGKIKVSQKGISYGRQPS